jgi:hypothetical protein
MQQQSGRIVSPVSSLSPRRVPLKSELSAAELAARKATAAAKKQDDNVLYNFRAGPGADKNTAMVNKTRNGKIILVNGVTVPTKKKFIHVLNELLVALKTLRAFEKKLAGRTGYLQFALNQQVYRVDRKSLTILYKKFVSEFKKLNNYYLAAKKRGSTPDQNDYNYNYGKGVYSPIQAGQALTGFLSQAQIADFNDNPVQGLTQLRQGKLLRVTFTLFMYTYAKTNGLLGAVNKPGNMQPDMSYTKSDPLMDTWFGQAPAAVDKDTNNVKVTNNRGPNGSALSTYAILTRQYQGPATVAGTGKYSGQLVVNDKLFKPAGFKTWYFQVIGGLNYYGMKDLQPQQQQALMALLPQMQAEYNLVKDAAKTYKEAKEAAETAAARQRKQARIGLI